MNFGAEEYRRAAGDRLREAGLAYAGGEYVLAHLQAGLAIECVLRAYRRRVSAEFVPRHDLARLATEFFAAVVPNRRGPIFAALEGAALAWRNNHRYCDAGKLRADLLGRGVLPRSRDIVKENALLMFDRAQTIVAAGERGWTAPNDPR